MCTIEHVASVRKLRFEKMLDHFQNIFQMPVLLHTRVVYSILWYRVFKRNMLLLYYTDV